MDKENITIIIATENNVNTIVRAIESVSKGFRIADQIIVGDNDSTDGTYEKLCSILGADSVTIDGQTGLPPEFDGKYNGVPIKIFRKRKTTIGHTLNIAMQRKWQGVTLFGFLDPTSWYAPDKIIQSVYTFNSVKSVACVVSDCDNHHEDGRVERIFRKSYSANRLNDGFLFDTNFLIRPQILQKMGGGFNEQLMVRYDYDMCVRISEVGLVYHIPAPLHHNIVKPLDESVKKLIQQEENAVREFINTRQENTDGKKE